MNKMNNKKPSEESREKIQISLPLNRRLLKYVLAIVLIIAVAYTAVTQPQKILSFLGGVISLLSPFIWGFCFAYVVNLLMRPLERFWDFIWRRLKSKKIVDKIKRPLCLALSFLIVLGVIFAVVFMVIPALKNTVVTFVGKVPKYVKTIESWYQSAAEFFAKYNFKLPVLVLDFDKVIGYANDFITNYGNSVLDKTVNITASIVSAVVELVLGIAFAVYLLAQKEIFGRQTKKVVHALLKKEKAEKLVSFT